MARNEFEKATTNYGNHFDNNGGNHHYTTYGHEYDDSAYVLCYFPSYDWHVGDRYEWHNNGGTTITYTSTKNGYPSNNVTTYGQGYDLKANRIITSEFGTYKLESGTIINEYTDYHELTWPNNINTKGKIETVQSVLAFGVSSVVMSASGGIINIKLPKIKFTGTTDTRGYRYVDVTIKPKVAANPEICDDDGTDAANATVQSTTYVGENRQGFLNFKEPKMQYPIYLSYVDKPDGAPPFFEMTSVPSMSDGINPIESITTTQRQIFTYSYWYDNVGRNYAYAYAPYGHQAQYKNPGPSWNYKDPTLKIQDNFLSTYPKVMTLSYRSDYLTFSYDGGTFPFSAKFVYNGTYQDVTTSTPTDTGFYTYTRYIKVYDGNLLSIENSTTTPTYFGYSYTIQQDYAYLYKYFNWSLPEKDGSGKNNFDSKTNVKYVSFPIRIENEYVLDGESTRLTINKQDHYKGSATGKLDFIGLPLDRVLKMSHNSTKDYHFGNIEWKDCENRTQRYFYVKCSSKFDNCRNQNITSITDEYVSGDKRKPEVTLKCGQLPAHWEHPIFRGHFTVKNQYNNDNAVLPKVTFSTKGYDYYNNYGTYSSASAHFDWGISESSKWPKDVSRDDANNLYLPASIHIPSHAMPWIRGKVNSGSTVTMALEKDTFSCDGDSTDITYKFAINANQGYNKGFERQQWKVTLDKYDTTYVAMDNNLTPFDPFTIEMNAQESVSYTWPTVTMNVSRTNTSVFSINKSQIRMGGETGKDVLTSLFDKDGNNTTVNGAVSVEATSNNKERGTWSATLASDGGISISSSFKNKDSRSTTVTIGNPYTDTKSDGAANISVNKQTFDITQNGEKWSETITFTQSGDGSVKTGTWTLALPANTSANATSSTSRWGLKSALQRYLSGIGTLKITNTKNIPSNGDVTISTSGDYATDSVASKTLTWSVSASLSTTPTYPSNASTNGVIGSGSIKPLAPSCTIQYKSDKNNSWSNSSSINVGSNTGSMTTWYSVARNSRTGADICNGAWDYTAGYYTGAGARTVKLQVRVVDDNDSTKTASCDDVPITQDGDSGSTGAVGANYEFEISASSNCTCGTPSSTNWSKKDLGSVGSFSVSLSGYSDGSYTEKQSWMDTFSGTGTPGITGYSENYELNTKSPNEDGKKFGVNESIEYTMSVTGKGDIYIGTADPYKWTFTYYYKVRRKDNTSDEVSSGNLNGNGAYYPYNATLYSPKYQWYKDGNAISGATSSSYKATSVGVYECKVKWTDGYVKSASWKVTQESRIYRTNCTMSVTNAYIDAWAPSGTTSCSFTATIEYSEDGGVSWTSTGNTDTAVTINQSSKDLSPTAGSSASDYGSGASFTFKLSGGTYRLDGKTSDTGYVYRYGKTYYNS